jgi:hypothetical protein
MKKYLLIIAVLNWTHLRSQDTFYFTKTNLFFELGGPAFLSGNIERLFNISNSLNLVGPAGTKEIDINSQDLVDKGTIISSPANKIIVYKLEIAFDIIVAHEKRHLEQAREVLQILNRITP